MLAGLRGRGFDVEFHSHAEAILKEDFPPALAELESVLIETSIPITEIIRSGGGEAAATQRMRRALSAKGWTKTKFEIKKIVNGIERESTSHEIDHVKTFDKGTIALELEWNNKDPFFDRDLENFKRLHAEGAISLGVVVTRGLSLHKILRSAVQRFAEDRNIASFADLVAHGVTPTARQRGAVERRAAKFGGFSRAWAAHFVSDKFGEATTHWRKLQDRVRRGVGNPCPLLLIGLSDQIITFD